MVGLMLGVGTLIWSEQIGYSIRCIDRCKSSEPLPYVNVMLRAAKDTILFRAPLAVMMVASRCNIKPKGDYILELSFVGYITLKRPLYIGKPERFSDLGNLELKEDAQLLQDITITATADAVNEKLDKKTFTVAGTLARSPVARCCKNTKSSGRYSSRWKDYAPRK